MSLKFIQGGGHANVISILDTTINFPCNVQRGKNKHQILIMDNLKHSSIIHSQYFQKKIFLVSTLRNIIIYFLMKIKLIIL